MKKIIKLTGRVFLLGITISALFSCVGFITTTPLDTLSGNISIGYQNPYNTVVMGTELTAIYTGSEPVSFQWRLNGNNISGATGDRYVAWQPGRYSVSARLSGYYNKTSPEITVIDPNPPAPRPTTPSQPSRPAPAPAPAPTQKPAPAPAPAPAPVPQVSVNINPVNQQVTAGSSLQFAAVVSGNSNTRVTWKVSSTSDMRGSVTSGTAINSNGRLTVSANEKAKVLYVTVTSAADTSKFAMATITVVQPAPPPPPPAPTPQQRPDNQRPSQGNQGNQNNQRPGQGNQPATPAPTPTPAQVISVSISPSNPTVAVGSPLQLSATVTGTSNTRVTWKVGSNSNGTGSVGNGTSINNNGRLTISANERNTVLYVVATSAEDPSKSAVVAVTVILGDQGQGNQRNQGNQGNRGR